MYAFVNVNYVAIDKEKVPCYARHFGTRRMGVGGFAKQKNS